MTWAYDEATALFLWLGFQLSDDNDCHRWPEDPVGYIEKKLIEAEARAAAHIEEIERNATTAYSRGRADERESRHGGDYFNDARQIVFELTGEANKAKIARVELILSGQSVRLAPEGKP